MSQKQRKTKKTFSKRRSTTSQSKVDKRVDAGVAEHEDRGGSHDNDVEWYAENQYLLADAARLPFSNPAGFSQPIGVIKEWSGSAPTISTSQFTVPAVCALEIAPTLGPDTGATSPLNVAARNAFGFIRANQTVNALYNQVTLMMYIVAMTAAYSFYAFCARIYGLLGLYDQRNRALPLALFEAMGVDFASFHTQKADFRYWLNNFANKVGALAVPSNMSYTKRAMWLYQNVFKDGFNDKSQVYVYTPAAFFKYNPVGSTDTPALDYISIANRRGVAKLTFSDIMQIGEEMMAPLFQNNVINTISGDIIKAYGLEKVWQLVPIPESYEVYPTLELNVLDQIHNAFRPGLDPLFGETSQRIAADDVIRSVVVETVDAATATSYLKPQYKIASLVGTHSPSEMMRYSWGWTGVMIDFDKQDVTPADIMVATRLTATQYKPENLATPAAIPSSLTILCGSEMITRMRVYYANEDNSGFSSEEIRFTAGEGMNQKWIRPFYKHPMLYDFLSEKVNLSSDVENWTFLNESNLFKLHETALLSEFHVPLSGRLIK